MGARLPDLANQVDQLARVLLPKDIDEELLQISKEETLKVLTHGIFEGDNQPISEPEIVAKIKRRLARNNRESDAVRFGNLCTKLRDKSLVQRRAELFQFLLSISQKSPSAPRATAEPYALAFPNYRNGTPFAALNGDKRPVSGISSSQHQAATNGRPPASSSAKHSHTHDNPHLTKQFLIRNPPPPSKQPEMGNQQNGGSSYEPIGLNDPKSTGLAQFLRPSQSLFMTDLGSKLSSSGFRRSKSRESGLASSVPPSIRTSKSAYSTSTTPAVSDVSYESRCSVAIRDEYNRSKIVYELNLLRDCFYVLQGINGENFNMTSDGASLFFLNPEKVSRPVRTLLSRISECGWLFLNVRNYIQSRQYSQNNGLISQSFCSSMNDEVEDYYRLLAVLQAEFEQFEQEFHLGVDTFSMSLRRLLVLTLGPRERLKLLATLVEMTKTKRGGSLLNLLYSFHNHGDPSVQQVIYQLLTVSCRPLVEFVSKWVCDGTLEDLYDEFFIAANPNASDEDQLWHNRYKLRKDMIPSFITGDEANKILLTGKSINFLRIVCKERTQNDTLKHSMQQLRSVDGSCLFDTQKKSQFHSLIKTAYNDTNKTLLTLLNEKFILRSHFTAIKKYILLCQGDFARLFMDILHQDLGKPAEELYMHHMTESLDTALKQSNAQYEPPEVLDRLDIHLLNKNPGNKGWDVFVLKYHVRGPISTVFSEDTMSLYFRLFDFIWRVKRFDFILSQIWSAHMSFARLHSKTIPDIGSIYRSFQLLGSEMMHFIQQVQYYFTTEVLECAWSNFVQQLDKAENLDFVIDAHTRYVNLLVKRIFLDQAVLAVQVRTVFDLILNFESSHCRFVKELSKELELQNAFKSRVASSTKEGKWGSSGASEQKELDRRSRFASGSLALYEPELDMIRSQYRTTLQAFLVSLAEQEDDQLRWLSFRLDFSEFYRKKDPRLNTSVSYRRQSSRY